MALIIFTLSLICSSAIAQSTAPAVSIDSSGEVSLRALSIRADGATTVLSTGGFNTAGTITFSSNVVIAGDVLVQSAKARALRIPAGGLIIGEDNADIAPGHIRSKEIKTSTLTLVGSAILFQDPITGAIQSTWSRTGGIDMGGAQVKGKLLLKNSGATAPPGGDCNSSSVGAFYERTDSPKIYYCRSDLTWGVLTMTAAP